MRSSRYISVVVITVVLVAACSSEPTEPGEVVGAWAEAAGMGDVETARSYIASDDIPWIGLGESPEAYAAGAGPYEANSFFVECTTDHTLGRCELWWNDRWIDAIPELAVLDESGDPVLRTTGEVNDGNIVAFREWVFAPQIRRAFEAHVDWLAIEDPAALEAACGADPASATCSQLLVDTVGMWVADR